MFAANGDEPIARKKIAKLISHIEALIKILA